MKNNRLLILCLLVLTGCAEFSKIKVDADGRYRFKELPVQVAAPSDCLLDMFVYEGPRAVGFMTGRGYWRYDGYYELQIWQRPEHIVAEVDFFQDAYKVSKSYAEAEGRRRKMNFEWRGMDFLDEFHLPAFQVLGRDEASAQLLATFVLLDDYIAVVSLQYPISTPDGAKMQIPMECYNQFLDSVRQIKPLQPVSG